MELPSRHQDYKVGWPMNGFMLVSTKNRSRWVCPYHFNCETLTRFIQTPWTAPVQRLRERLETLLECSFDYVLLNLYRDGKDSIGFHSDGEAIPEGKRVIASISLGSKRTFIIRHKDGKDTREYLLNNGSLLVMMGDTQQFYKHRSVFICLFLHKTYAR